MIENLRRYGPDAVRKLRDGVAEQLANFGRTPSLPSTVEAIVERCREASIPLIFVWIPESPTLTARYPQIQAVGEIYATQITQNCHCTLFRAPELSDEDFADGFDLLPKGAERYSRWLANTQLKPWLISTGLMQP